MKHSFRSPLVSVIIPSYNHAQYLRERIESVLGQDYPDFEVIMLDDHSTDDSAEIMRSYQGHERLSHMVVNERNSGNTFLQWEKGIILAKGEYIWIAESDDTARPDFLTRQMAALLATPDAVLSFCRSTMIDDKGCALDYSWDEPWRYKSPGIYDGRDFCLHRMVYKNLMYNASMVVFRKRYYYNINNEYQRYRHSGDWLFWFSMCIQGKVCEVPESLNMFRQHGNKVSNEALGRKDLAEIVEIQSVIADTLHLSSYQRRCLRGRQTKRLNKSSYDDKERLRRQYPAIYGGTVLDSMLYALDKTFNFSGLQK